MTRINLTKYGFIRCPKEDYTDDHCRFQVYQVGRVRVTKHVSNNEVYINCSVDGFLYYKEYSMLPHFSELDRLNGVGVESVTEQDLIQLYNDCVEYEKEYYALENTIRTSLPTEDEIRKACITITERRQAELTNVNSRLATLSHKLLTCCSDYEWRQIREYYNRIIAKMNQYDVDVYPKAMVGNPNSRSFVREDSFEFAYSFPYEALMSIFDKIENL